jgi:AbrB family looped-hinge helix DNA binding protein
MMSALVKIHSKGQMTLPIRLRSQAGISEGDLVEAAFHRGKIVLTPKVVLDRSRLPNPDDEYTPKQRRAIDRGIAQSLKEIGEGRSYGPFDSHAAFVASLRTESKKLRRKKSNRVA